MENNEKIKKIIFGIIGFIIQVVLSYIFVVNDELIILIIPVIFTIVLLCFKKTRIGAIIGIVFAIFIYYLIMPLSEKYDVQHNICSLYGDGYKAVKYTNKYVQEKTEEYCHGTSDCGTGWAFHWYCVGPNGEIQPGR